MLSKFIIKPTKWQLRTATGHPDNKHGEIEAQVNLEITSFKKLMLDDKLDIMNFK